MFVNPRLDVEQLPVQALRRATFSERTGERQLRVDHESRLVQPSELGAQASHFAGGGFVAMLEPRVVHDRRRSSAVSAEDRRRIAVQQ